MAIYYDGYDWDIDGFPGEYVFGDYGYSGHFDEYYMDERWKRIYDIPEYWISTKARVWSSISMSFVYGTPLKSGHIDMSLRCNGRRVHRYLHRLVAEAFIPNLHGYPEVRHLNDDPSDNEVENLAWGTQSDNMCDCIRNGHFYYLTERDIERANEVRRTPIVAVRLCNGEKLFFNSQQEASRRLGIDQASINAVVRGKNRSAGGYFFAKENEFDKTFDYRSYSYQRRGMTVKAMNLNTGETRIYDKPRQVALDLGMSETLVSNVLHGKARSAKGWTFKTLDSEGDNNE